MMTIEITDINQDVIENLLERLYLDKIDPIMDFTGEDELDWQRFVNAAIGWAKTDSWFFQLILEYAEGDCPNCHNTTWISDYNDNNKMQAVDCLVCQGGF